jgi:hypothetical protein
MGPNFGFGSLFFTTSPLSRHINQSCVRKKLTVIPISTLDMVTFYCWRWVQLLPLLVKDRSLCVDLGVKKSVGSRYCVLKSSSFWHESSELRVFEPRTVVNVDRNFWSILQIASRWACRLPKSKESEWREAYEGSSRPDCARAIFWEAIFGIFCRDTGKECNEVLIERSDISNTKKAKDLAEKQTGAAKRPG